MEALNQILTSHLGDKISGCSWIENTYTRFGHGRSFIGFGHAKAALSPIISVKKALFETMFMFSDWQAP